MTLTERVARAIYADASVLARHDPRAWEHLPDAAWRQYLIMAEAAIGAILSGDGQVDVVASEMARLLEWDGLDDAGVTESLRKELRYNAGRVLAALREDRP